MLTIRLSRIGKKKQPSYRLIVSEKARDPWGKSLEILGNYNPRSKQAVFDIERVKYWISKGATTSDTVWNLLVGLKVVDDKKRKVVPMPKPTGNSSEPVVLSDTAAGAGVEGPKTEKPVEKTKTEEPKPEPAPEKIEEPPAA